MQKPLLGFVVAAVIGAVLFVIVGYFAYAASSDAVGFAYWVRRPLQFSGLYWALLGAAVGCGLRYLQTTR
jgi:hypothetical protein